MRNDAGQTLLIVAGVLAGVALTAVALYLNLDAGRRVVDRLKAGNASQASALPAVIAYYFTQVSHTGGTVTGPGSIPCPSATSGGVPTGSQNASGCDGSTSAKPNAGVLPWVTLGLSKDQAIDAYGNFFTYVVSPDAQAICETITNGRTSAKEVTGTLATSSLRVTDSTGTTSTIPFAIIGHGANKLGALSSNSVANSSPSSSGESANCDPTVCSSHSPLMGTTTALVSGPFNGSQGSSAFDDQVFVPSKAVLQKMCQTLTPGGGLNTTLSDTFTTPTSTLTNNAGVATGLDSTKYSADSNNVTQSTDANHTGNQVAKFSAGGSIGAILVTNTTNYNFDPRIRPLHVSAVWTPDVTTVGTGGMSIGTRVSAPDQSSLSDDFSGNGKHGMTFRFYNQTSNNISSTGVANSISIRNSGSQLAISSGTYKLISGKTYLIEAYDDGQYVWARITQTDDYTNTAVVNTTVANTSDVNGENQVAFVGGANVNYVDDLAIGVGMLALNTNASSSGYVTASNLNFTGDLTVEAWIRARSIPGSTSYKTIMASWDPSASTLGSNAFRLMMSGSKLELDLSGVNGSSTNINESYTTGYTPVLGEWHHIAAVYSKSAATVTFYVDGEINGSASPSGLSSAGVVAGTQAFTVGAHSCATTTGGFCSTTPADGYFTGDISDVRVWNTARDASTILSDYNRRLSYSTTSGVSSLILNWKFDQESANFGSAGTVTSTGTTSARTGTLTNATYIASLANYYRAFAGSVHDAAGNQLSGVCPSSATVAGSYECDFRATSDSANFTFASNLYGAYVKMWGGGGGGFASANLTGAGCTGGSSNNTCISAGGGGGYSSGFLYKIGSTGLPGALLDVVVGGGGTGSSTFTPGSTLGGNGNGAGGGGASVLRLASASTNGLVAGGGGGASFSNTNFFAAGLTTLCYALVNNPMAQCGIGGGGGGSGASTARAWDASGNGCAGRGGDNSPSGSAPPDSTYCAKGGDDPGYVNGSLTNSLATGASGGGTASGGSSVTTATIPVVLAPGGAGYDASAVDGGVGGGGGGGGMSTSGTSAGGGEAGAYKLLGYDTITIGGTPSSGDIINITFTNASITGFPVTARYTVQSTDTTTSAVAAGLVTNSSNTGISNLTALTGATYSGTSAAVSNSRSSNVISIFQQSNIATSTALSYSITAAGNETATLSSCGTGGNLGSFQGNNNSASCSITIGPTTGFSPRTGDTISMTFSSTDGQFTNTGHCVVAGGKPHSFTYTVTSSDTTANLLAFHLATAINADTTLTSNSCYGIAATPTNGTTTNIVTMTGTSSVNNNSKSQISSGPTVNTSGGLGTETVTFGSTNLLAIGKTPSGTTVTTGSSNGFGGGGGSGYKDAAASNTLGQTGLAAATATIGSITVGNTYAITFTNSSISGLPETITTTAVTNDTPTSVAERLASLISFDTTLSGAGVSASIGFTASTSNVITITQQGSYTQQSPFGTGTTLTSAGTGTVTLSYPTACTWNATGYLSAGCAGNATDYYYAPSGYTTTYTSGAGGASGGNGSPGAVLLFW